MSASGGSAWPTPDASISTGYNQTESPGAAVRPALAALWPTATATDAKASGAAAYSTASGRHSGTTLTDAAVRGLWSTPTSSMATNGNAARGGDRSSELLLPGQAMRWATPTTRDWKDADGSANVPTNGMLGRQPPRWLTPTQSDANGTRASREERGWSAGLNTAGRPDPATKKPGGSGQVLNPLFVEALMGLPAGWTDCGCWETASSHSKSSSPSEIFCDESEARS